MVTKSWEMHLDFSINWSNRVLDFQLSRHWQFQSCISCNMRMNTNWAKDDWAPFSLKRLDPPEFKLFISCIVYVHGKAQLTTTAVKIKTRLKNLYVFHWSLPYLEQFKECIEVYDYGSCQNKGNHPVQECIRGSHLKVANFWAFISTSAHTVEEGHWSLFWMLITTSPASE